MATVVTDVVPERSGSRRRAGWWALAIGLCGFGYRLVAVLSDSPPTNSDEATMGLAALHIAGGRDFPVFFYGQHYMGTLEAYLAAPLFLVAGPSVLALRIPALLLYAVFVAAMYALTRRLYDPRVAVLTVAVLALGSDRVIKNQLISAGGYPELGPAIALLFLVALALGLAGVRHRTLAYGACGLLVGLLLWVDWLALPYLAAAGTALVLTGGRELLGRNGLALLAGTVLGAAPALAYNLRAAPGADSLTVFLHQNADHGTASLGSRLVDGWLFGVPMGTGLCAQSRCGGWSMWWGVAYPVLLLVSGALAVYGLRRCTDRVRHGYRLALVLAAAGTLLAYVRSSAPAVDRIENARYLSLLLVSTPAVLWPLVAAIARREALWRTVSALGLAAILGTGAAATVGAAAQIPATHQRAVNLRTLVETLRDKGITRIYSDYWSCDLITFLAREDIQCAVVTDDLRPGQDRYLPYRAAVAAADHPAYVIPVNLPLDANVAARVGHTEVLTVAGYHVYR